jgi:hypothetical protein
VVDNGVTDNLINPVFHPFAILQTDQALLDFNEYVLKDVFSHASRFDPATDKTEQLVVVVLPERREPVING